MAYLTSLDAVTQVVYDRVNAGANSLGLRAVYYADNDFTPRYPCAVVAHGRVAKERWTTGNKFRYTFSVFVYVLHSDMNLTKAMRTKADIQLAELVSGLAENGYTLGGAVVNAHMEAIEPALMPGQRKGNGVVASRITLFAESRD